MKKLISAAALSLVAATPAFAANVTIDFEATPGFINSILEAYNGGTDSLSQSGTNYGVSFTDAVVGLSNDVLGPYYLNAPSPLTTMAAYDASAIMNVASGFAGSLKFFYSSLSTQAAGALETQQDVVKIYSGLNATGTLLATVSLFSNAQLGCTGAQFCRFDQTSVQFAGIAKSVSFGSNAQTVLYDNINITTVPEPTSVAMMLAGASVLGFLAVRRRG
jgi:hypothetical protein